MSFTVSDAADRLRLRVRDALGQLVLDQVYASTSGFPAGRDSVSWDGRDNSGVLAPEGTYQLYPGAFRGAEFAEVLAGSVVVDTTAPRVDSLYVPNPVLSADTCGGRDTAFIFFTLRDYHAGDGDVVGVTLLPDSGSGDSAISLDLKTVAESDSASSFDLAGNESREPRRCLEYVTAGPRIRTYSPFDSTISLDSLAKLDRTLHRAYLNTFPPRLIGTLIDRVPVQRLSVRFGSADSVLATLDQSVTPTRWSVATPDSTNALHREGELVVTYRATNIYGCGTNDVLHLFIDFTPPSRLVLDHTLPAQVHRSLFIISGTAAGADSLIIWYTPPGGSERRIAKGPVIAGGTAFRDSLFLQPGVTTYRLQTVDLAHNFSSFVNGSVEFTATAGMGAPQAFHAGDAFLARLDDIAERFEVRIYRPDGGLVRRLVQESSTDFSGRNFEATWDLNNEQGAPVGRGPYVCVLRAFLSDGTTQTRRLAVVAMP